MRFERIYVGAGASARTAALLFRMLEIGGVIVGPFAGAHGGAQRLLKATRTAEDKFDVRRSSPYSLRRYYRRRPTPAYPLAYHYSPPPPPRGPRTLRATARPSRPFGSSRHYGA